MSNIVILLTSCIRPNGMIFTVLQNQEERRRQYREALLYYVHYTKYKIVFCDNSGVDVSDFKISNRVEILSFKGNDYDKTLGKGYGEFEIIRYAVAHSIFLSQASHVVKITGRLRITNLSDSINWTAIHFPFVQKSIYCVINEINRLTDSRCFLLHREFLSQFVNASNICNDSANYYFEHLLFDCIEKYGKDYLISGFAIPLNILGQSGTSGNYYYDSEMSLLTKISNLEFFNKQQRKNKSSVYLLSLAVILRVYKCILRIIGYMGRSLMVMKTR